MGVSHSSCKLNGYTASLAGIGNRYFTGMNCTGPTANYTEIIWISRPGTGTNARITGMQSNQLDFGNCVYSSASYFSFTGLNCVGSTYSNTGAVGATGATGVTGATGATGNIVFTLSGYALTDYGTGGSGSSTIVNNVVDYSELQNSTATGVSIALVIILVLVIIVFSIKGLFNKIFK